MEGKKYENSPLYSRNQLRSLKNLALPEDRARGEGPHWSNTRSLSEAKSFVPSRNASTKKVPPVPIHGNRMFEKGKERRYSPFHAPGQVIQIEYRDWIWLIKLIMFYFCVVTRFRLSFEMDVMACLKPRIHAC